MMHGMQKMELTHKSVMEALQDYLTKHMGKNVEVTITKWIVAKNDSGYTDPNSPTIAIEFKQEDNGEMRKLEDNEGVVA